MLKEKNEYFDCCSEILTAVDNDLERVCTSIFTIAEIWHILVVREKIDPAKVKSLIDAFLKSKGLVVAGVDLINLDRVMELVVKYKVDFVDAMNVQLMDFYNIPEIYSLDSDYDKFKEIKRFVSLT